MAQEKISELPELLTAPQSGDFFVVAEDAGSSVYVTKKILYSNIAGTTVGLIPIRPANNQLSANEIVEITATNGVLVEQTLLKDGFVQLTQISSPSAPAAGKTLLYGKTDGKLYSIVNGGVETEIGSGGGSGSGYKTLYIPASQITPRSDSGATPNFYESPTNKIHIETLDFDPDVAQYSQFNLIMPEEWNRSTVKVKFLWFADTGAGNVVWCIQSQALSDDDAIEATWGTAVTVTDVLTTLLDNQLTGATGALTTSGTPALADNICFQVYRDKANNVSDTFTGIARLIGVWIQYSATNTPTAW